MAYAKKTVIEELENAWLSGELDIDPADLDDRDFCALPVEVIIYAFAQLKSRAMTLPEVLASDSFKDISMRSSNNKKHTEAFYRIWVDKEALIAREDNILVLNETKDWKTGYNRALADYVLAHGTPMNLNADHFSWEDYFLEKSLLSNPQAIFGIQEDYWDEFMGTGHSEFCHGMSADVFYESGISRRVRVVAELGEIVREITEK